MVLISTPCVAPPPLTHAFSLCLLKSGTQLSPFSDSLFHPPSLSLTENESLEHNYPCSLSLSLLHFIPPSLSPALSLHLSWLQEKSVKGAAAEIFIDLFSSVLFISLSSPIALPTPPHRPRNTSSAVRCQRRRRRWMKIHNMKPLFSICCTRPFHLRARKTKGNEWRGTGWAGLMGMFSRQPPLWGVVDRRHQDVALFFVCQCKASCTQPQAIEVVVVMATMPRAIIITMVTVLVAD